MWDMQNCDSRTHCFVCFLARSQERLFRSRNFVIVTLYIVQAGTTKIIGLHYIALFCLGLAWYGFQQPRIVSLVVRILIVSYSRNRNGNGNGNCCDNVYTPYELIAQVLIGFSITITSSWTRLTAHSFVQPIDRSEDRTIDRRLCANSTTKQTVYVFSL